MAVIGVLGHQAQHDFVASFPKSAAVLTGPGWKLATVLWHRGLPGRAIERRFASEQFVGDAPQRIKIRTNSRSRGRPRELSSGHRLQADRREHQCLQSEWPRDRAPAMGRRARLCALRERKTFEGAHTAMGSARRVKRLQCSGNPFEDPRMPSGPTGACLVRTRPSSVSPRM